MTTEERTLTESQRILDGSPCPCGNYGATITYEPGVCWITCNHCTRSVCVADFEIQEAMGLWGNLTTTQL
jgi:hypothetical protein